mgnify:CR=1 FL=1|tara:strand:+ start:1309 stop:1533 length:225 start_codon:yes stop_codon:yes gene_type:complete
MVLKINKSKKGEDKKSLKINKKPKSKSQLIAQALSDYGISSSSYKPGKDKALDALIKKIKSGKMKDSSGIGVAW